MGKKGDLSDFERGMVVGARWAGLSISKTADLLGFSRTTISRVYSRGLLPDPNPRVPKYFRVSGRVWVCS